MFGLSTWKERKGNKFSCRVRRLFILTKEKDGQAKRSVEKFRFRHTQQRKNIRCTYIRTHGGGQAVRESHITVALYGRAIRPRFTAVRGLSCRTNTTPPLEGGAYLFYGAPRLERKNWHLNTHNGTMSGRGSTTCNSDAGTILMSASRPGWCHGLVVHRRISS